MEQLNVNNKMMNIVIFSRKEYFNTIFPTLMQISRDSLLSLSTYRKRPVKSSITVKKNLTDTLSSARSSDTASLPRSTFER